MLDQLIYSTLMVSEVRSFVWELVPEIDVD